MSKAKPTARYTPLAKQIKELVENSGLTTNALAVAAGVPQPVLYRFLTGGQENLRLDTIDKLCEFFQVRLTKPPRPAPKGE